MPDPTVAEQLQATANGLPPEPLALSSPDQPGWWLASRNRDVGAEIVYVDPAELAESDHDFSDYDFWIGPFADRTPDDSTPVEDVDASFADRLKRFVELELRRRDLETAIKDTKERARALEATLVEDFAEQGTQSVRCSGLTCYVGADKYVSKLKGVETDDVCAMLEQVGRGDLVKDGYNAASLKAWVLEQVSQRDELRRLIAEAKDVPPKNLVEQLAEVEKIEPLLPLLSIGAVIRIKTRK